MSELELWWLKRAGFGRARRALYYRRLAAFVKDGVPLFDALERLRERHQHNGDPRAKMLGVWIQDLRRGRRLGEVLAGWSPPEEAVLITAAERGGQLAEGLEIAAGMADSMGRVVDAVRGAVTYPAVIFLALVGLVVFFSVSLVPQLADSLPPEQWTGDAAAVYVLSQAVTNGWWLFALALAALVVVVMTTLATWTGEVREWVDHRVPPWSLYRAYQSAAFLVALSAMTRAGVPVMDSVMSIRDQSSPWMRGYLARAIRSLRGGLSPGVALALPLFDPDTADDIHVYGASGAFESALAGIGARVVEHTVRLAGQIAKVVNALMLLAGGLTIGWIYLAIYGLTQTVGGAGV